MPELPEVEHLTLELHRTLQAEEIARVEVRNASLLETNREVLEKILPGKRVLEVARRAKYIRVKLSDGWLLWFHLGMTGQLYFDTVSSDLPHTHVVFFFRATEKVLTYRDVRRFGKIALTPSWDGSLPRGVRRLGREPGQWDQEAFASFIKRRKARIKNLLLNQQFIAGLGNIYSDESLHRAGIHPLRRANRLPRKRLLGLHRAICEVLEEAIRYGGSSIDDYLHLDGSRGRFQRFHRVYGRGGESCLTCGATIRSVRLSNRTSSFCPQCQS